MLFDELSLTNICVNKTLNILLDNCSDITLQQLKESTYDDRLIFFEDYIYYPIAVLLADRYTVLNDYPPIIAELYPFSLKDLLLLKTVDTYESIEFTHPPNVISIIGSNNELELVDLAICVYSDMRKKDIKSIVMDIIISVSLLKIITENNASRSYKIQLYNSIKHYLTFSEINSVPMFRTKILNTISHFTVK